MSEMRGNKIPLWNKLLAWALLIAIAFAFAEFFRVANDTQAGADVSSIFHILITLPIIQAPEEQWKPFTQEAYTVFANQHAHEVDSSTLVDPWGKSYGISVRHQRHKAPEYLVWSNGRDGRIGTSDDIYIHAGSSGVTFGPLVWP